MHEELPGEPNGAELTVDFVRQRNVLLVRADLGPLFTDYYLHLADHQLRHSPAQDSLFKHALAAFALHCASRPRNEHLAWTLNFQEPRLNIFLAGDNEDCTVTGRLFTENVKAAAENTFFSDVVPRRGAEVRRSMINFTGNDVFAAASGYYARSEQRPVRYLSPGGDEFAMLVAHPDCDLTWFNAADAARLRDLLQPETLARIERRPCRWLCGCNQRKILGAIASAFRTDPGEMFGGAEVIRVECPRCAAAHVVTRETMESYLAHEKQGGE